tara:strand:+ start:290 stop:478 length:189 start_codon:yes stop_codon:yes gene_type:complete
MIQYLVVFEYTLSKVILETIEFSSLKKKNEFDFENYVIYNYGSSTTYMCVEEIKLETLNTKL